MSFRRPRSASSSRSDASGHRNRTFGSSNASLAQDHQQRMQAAEQEYSETYGRFKSRPSSAPSRRTQILPNPKGAETIAVLLERDRPMTAGTLSEGFPGGHCKTAPDGKTLELQRGASKLLYNPSRLKVVMTKYLRVRQDMFDLKQQQRGIPQSMNSELVKMEGAACALLRPLHPQLYQRFDEAQLARALRVMPILRLGSGYLVYGELKLFDEAGQANKYKAPAGPFLLIHGTVVVWERKVDQGDPNLGIELGPGCIFGEARFKVGKEEFHSYFGKAARCLENCIIAVLSKQCLDAAFTGHRGIVDSRIKSLLSDIKLLQTDMDRDTIDDIRDAGPISDRENEKLALPKALEFLAQRGSYVDLAPGQILMADEPIEKSVLVVTRGSAEVLADVRFKERMDKIPPKRLGLKILIESAEGLIGDSRFDKLDPYCVVTYYGGTTMQRLQTPTLKNAGTNPKWNHRGSLRYDQVGETVGGSLEFTVMDWDRFSSDDLIGSGHLNLKDVPLDTEYSTVVQLKCPKQVGLTAIKVGNEPAGKLHVTLEWKTRKFEMDELKPKEREYPSTKMFDLRPNSIFGREFLLLEGEYSGQGRTEGFLGLLEEAAKGLKFEMFIDNPVVSCHPHAKESVQIFKIRGRDYLQTLRRIAGVGESRFKEMALKSMALQMATKKQLGFRDVVHRLLDEWARETHWAELLQGEKKTKVFELDLSKFRVAFRGAPVKIVVQNAVGLHGGGFFDKLDPYATVKFSGPSSQMIRTPTLQDVGSNPVWEHEGVLKYMGEESLEIQVWDEDINLFGGENSNDLIGSAILSVQSFCRGFEGTIELEPPPHKKQASKSKNPMLFALSLTWDVPPSMWAAIEEAAS